MSEGEAEFLKGLMTAIATRLNKIEKPTEKQETTILAEFSPHLRDLLTATQKDNDWIVTPKMFLGAPTFHDVATEVQELGGEYVSAGKNSHFRIPITK